MPTPYENMPTPKKQWTHDDIVRVIDDFGMPSEMADIIMTLRYRVRVLSDNDIVFDQDDIRNARIAQAVRVAERYQYLTEGTYLHGDLRTPSLASMFDTIGQMTRCTECQTDAHNALSRFNAVRAHEDDWCEVGEDDCSYLINEKMAIDELIVGLYDHVESEHTPRGYYFGGLEGDASDIGVWQEANLPDGWDGDDIETEESWEAGVS